MRLTPETQDAGVRLFPNAGGPDRTPMRPERSQTSGDARTMWTDHYADRAVTLLRETVAIPTFQKENVLADYLARLLSAKGLEVTTTEIEPDRPNIVAKWRPPGRVLGSVMFEAHLDTVPPSPSQRGITLEGRTLYGRGACDPRGGMAGMLAALECLADWHKDIPIEVYFVGAMGEETGAGGARSLMDSGFRVDAAVVAEPTERVVATCHKGLIWIRISMEAAAGAAGGTRSVGRAVGHIGKYLKEGLAGALAVDRHPDLGSRTVNVGTITSGARLGQGTGGCAIEIDVRILPGDRVDEIVSMVRTEVEGFAARLTGVTVKVEPTRVYPPLDGSADAPAARALAGALTKVEGEAKLGAVSYCTDGGLYAEAGIPTVVFGPGSIALAHSANEHVALDEVAGTAEVYYRFLIEYSERMI